MSEQTITTAIDYYLNATRFFQRSEFEKATQYISLFEQLDYSFVSQVAGDRFTWAPNVVCIVAHRQTEDTRGLLEALEPLFSDPDFCFVLVSNGPENFFPYAASLTGDRVLTLISGANFGASIGRNIAVKFANARTITFLDDDGVAAASSVRKLIETRNEYDATAVRGRVVPRNNFGNVPNHYDLGAQLKQRFMDIEGITTWNLAALKEFNFNPLLYGHEGVELTTRLYPIYGPDAFLYEPAAILRHDFIKSDADGVNKGARLKINDAFLASVNPDSKPIKSAFYNLDNDIAASRRISLRGTFAILKSPRSDKRKLSFITTCFNGSAYLMDYCKSIQRQTHDNFDVVFVDDGSTDDSVDTVAACFGSDSRLKVIKGDHAGRSAALNLALQHVDTEYAVIADVDDISVPQRAEWSLRAHEEYPSDDLIGFNIFDKTTSVRGTRPLTSKVLPISVRRYFGMPCPFPGVSFKVSSFTLPFDVTLAAGVDLDWMHRNFEANDLDGHFFPVGVSFYRTHEDQLTSKLRDLQRRTSIKCVRELHERLLRPFTPVDEEGLQYFTGWKPIATYADWQNLKCYSDRLLLALRRDRVPHAELVQDEIIFHVNERLVHLTKLDQRKLRQRAEIAEEHAKETGPLKERLARTESKLFWNRHRVMELEKTLAANTPTARIRKLFGLATTATQG